MASSPIFKEYPHFPYITEALQIKFMFFIDIERSFQDIYFFKYEVKATGLFICITNS